MNKETINDYLNITPIVFLFTIIILLLSIGYAVNSTTFAIDGSAMVRPIQDVRITNVSLNTDTNGGTLNENIEFANHTFYVNGHIPSALGANGNIIVDVTVTNLSSSSVIITGVNSTNFSNLNMEYEVLNVTPNETVIPPASDYTFQVKIKFKSGIIETILKFTESILETLFNISTNVVSTFQVSWSYVPQYRLTITAEPSDALILVYKDDNIIGSSTEGYFSELVDANSNITWSVSKDGYITVNDTDYMNQDKTHNVTLSTSDSHTLTINPTPSDALVVIKNGDTIIASGNGTQTVRVNDYNNIYYEVSKLNYVTDSGTVYTNGENKTLNIVLQEAQIFEGTFKNTSSNTATIVNETIYRSGYYLIELWGGKGGTGYNNNASYGLSGSEGYVNGIIYINANQKIYITLGGNGSNGTSTSSVTSGGVLGGGNSASGGGGGGGYSAVGLDITSINLSNVTSNNILLIASGGGGGGARTSALTNSGSGGAGGNINNSNTTSYSNGTIYNGFAGTTTTSNSSYKTTGGSNIGGTCSGQESASGSLLTGGAGYKNGGGGGSGFYGGGGGASRASIIINTGGGSGGAGGSSYVNSSVISPGSYSSSLTNTNPSTTGGAAIITYLGESLN